MIERNIVEEIIEFCSDYDKSKFDRCSSQIMVEQVFDIWGMNVVSKDHEELLQAHIYILNNTYKVIPYLFVHKAIVKENNPSQSEKW